MANLMDNECLITVVLVIVGVVFLLWLFLPNFRMRKTVTVEERERFNERFNGNSTGQMMSMEELAQDAQILPEELPSQQILPETQEIKTGPFVDVRTGSIEDGAGWQDGSFEDRQANEIEGVPANLPPSIPSNYYFLDDGAGGAMSLQHNLCSKSCCSSSYPVPFKQRYDPFVCANKSKFVPNIYWAQK